ncbi:MAG: hypothetical protein QG610_1740 [Euryarchaeota archaeon]|nr:hypothetical protein [Euryarchaeota archaeon]
MYRYRIKLRIFLVKIIYSRLTDTLYSKQNYIQKMDFLLSWYTNHMDEVLITFLAALYKVQWFSS